MKMPQLCSDDQILESKRSRVMIQSETEYYAKHIASDSDAV